MNATRCRRPNYHPFDESVAKIMNRENLYKPYNCKRKNFARRFQITKSDRIQLKYKLKSGRPMIFTVTAAISLLLCSNIYNNISFNQSVYRQVAILFKCPMFCSIYNNEHWV